ncbi:hypothetical protein PISMIDRAFT_688863 [Pisolithus microcarpus 441]|uniref:Unplaced genomic scaffold scaffold_322, whole genome shotgun sequence n=1 Tax=Pisolithus microcarpus 441 TaxID=765257 RepID=A0A0C9YZJ3_9AGAM|nr:hypothetical protein PISMIDRAFT_688863 [Pisolithus microcarpus 441]
MEGLPLSETVQDFSCASVARTSDHQIACRYCVLMPAPMGVYLVDGVGSDNASDVSPPIVQLEAIIL